MSPDPPANARSRRTRAALLDATRELLERDGFEALTMAAVADHAGVTRRAVYLHFASRADLVAELFDHVSETEGLAQSVQAVRDAPDAVAALDEWARHLARFHPRALAVTRAVEQVHRHDPDAAAHRDRYLREQLAACRALARRLAAEGRLAPAWTEESAAEMLWGLISVDLLERLLVERRWSARRLGDRLAVLLRSTFVADREAP
jgi:AcrR family transcriptional regulator